MDHISQSEEQKYIDLVQEILDKGEERPDRTGTGTLSLFSKTLSFDLSNRKIPLLTTKKVFWKGVVDELLFFIQGKTNSKELSEKGVKIWDEFGSREYLDSLGLTDREIGDLGPQYGFQWRHFGAEYEGYKTDYSGKGIDQLKGAIDLIKNNPTSRRIIISAWNPVQLKEMVLPPCHMTFQFYVSKGKELECLLFQRSCDVGLGLPFNIASYSLLTHLIAKICGLEAKRFTVVFGDTHIYLDHVEALKEQCKRPILNNFPRVSLSGEIKSLDDIKADKIVLHDYFPQGPIKMKMSK